MPLIPPVTVNNFSSGEVSDDAWERTDLAQARTGCAEGRNFLGLATGIMVSRPGAVDVGAAKVETTRQRKITWRRRDGEGLVLELGHEYARVWTAQGAPVMNGSVQVEFAHPFTADQLPGLRVRQIGDMAVVTANPGVYPRVILRNSDTDWLVDFYRFREGPWLPENTDPGKVLTLTEAGAVWTVESNFPFFTPDHVGTQLRIRGDGGGLPHRSWAPKTTFNAGEWVISVGRVYMNMSATGDSGNTPPTHDRGEISDGGRSWAYVHDGAGIIFIDSVADATHAEAQVPNIIPLVAPGPAQTSNWTEWAYGEERGWPTALSAVREERLVTGGTDFEPDTVHLTATYGFDTFAQDYKPGLGTGLVVDTDACRSTVGGERGRIVWIESAALLVVGTTLGEYIVTGSTVEDPIAPATVKARPLSNWGSADVMPVVIQGPPQRLIHAARGATMVRETLLSPDGASEGRDLSILAQHIFGKGVAEWAWTGAPSNTLWVRLADDSLAALTYHHEHGVVGVRRQELGGGFLVESLAAAPGPDGQDHLHLAVYRTKDEATQRRTFVIAPRARTGNVFVDGGRHHLGEPTADFTGLAHYEGEALAVLVDGARVTPDPVVTGGAFTLDEPSGDVVWGLPYLRRFVSLPLGQEAEGLAELARPTKGTVVLHGVEARIRAEAMDEPEAPAAWDPLTSRRSGDTSPVVRRMPGEVTFGGGADRDNRIVVECDAPFDLRLSAHRVIFERAER